jgi:hypothetical protein
VLVLGAPQGWTRASLSCLWPLSDFVRSHISGAELCRPARRLVAQGRGKAVPPLGPVDPYTWFPWEISHRKGLFLFLLSLAF